MLLWRAKRAIRRQLGQRAIERRRANSEVAAISSCGSTSVAGEQVSAIGRSKWLPSLPTSAGASLKVMWRGGSARPSAASLGGATGQTPLVRQPRGESHLRYDIDDLDAVERNRADARRHALIKLLSALRVEAAAMGDESYGERFRGAQF